MRIKHKKIVVIKESIDLFTLVQVIIRLLAFFQKFFLTGNIKLLEG